MSRLSVDPSGTHLVCDGAFFPLIIDTAWSSFADPTPDEWRTYLATRRGQGFTAVLVSALEIAHDRDERPQAREPFTDGHAFNDAYFEALREYTRIAHVEYGMRLMITVLWNNHLAGTWGAALTPHAVLPDDVRREYLTRLTDAVADLDPIFVVGGDDHYDVPTANAGYLEAIKHLRSVAPYCLLTTHTAPNATLPDAIADALDFFLHQSGHNVENQELTWRQPPRYLTRRPRRPLIASEPPYEQHGKINGYGRWTRDDVRRASWTSVLAGASAGIGYGAHGVWMWHTPTGRFSSRETSLEPFTWPEALAFPGARDISLLARLMVDHALYRLEPAQELLVDHAGEQFRAAANADRSLVALYQPYVREAELALDLGRHRVTGWDLARRAPIVPAVTVHDGHTRFGQLAVPGDLLYIAERRP